MDRQIITGSQHCQRLNRNPETPTALAKAGRFF
jgi:hypothetical protein